MLHMSKNAPWWHTNATKRFGIAVIVIGLSFSMIGGMLGVQQFVVYEQLKNMESNPALAGNATAIIEGVTESNTRVFNILVPVFAAWVGTVITFYFTTKSDKNDDKSEVNSDNTANSVTNYGDGDSINVDKILDLRFVNGEVSESDYRKIKSVLKEYSDSNGDVKDAKHGTKNF